MNHNQTNMRDEIGSIPQALDRLLVNGAADVKQAADLIRNSNIRYLLSVARGSSDHACTFLKYVSELLLQLPMASMGPSVASVYDVNVNATNALCIAISQSGQSPDIVRMLESTIRNGALGIAITNKANSPLASVSDVCLPIHANEEISVAATKSFVLSIITGLWLFAELKEDKELTNSIQHLPYKLEQASNCDWSEFTDSIAGQSIFTLGRGPALAISNEAALKFKETCQLHAESYSSAEVLHGPVSIINRGFPILGFTAADAAETALSDVCESLAAKGARVFVTSQSVKRATTLPHIRTGHALTDPISLIVSFYSMVEKLARSRGINPDVPRHLRKVTETI